MPRSTRSEADLLRQEARALELLANETEPPLERMQDYWQVSLDLLALVSDIDEFVLQEGAESPDDPRVLALRRRVRAIAARLSELSLD